MRRDITSHTRKLIPASGSQQTLQITLSPWVGIRWDLNVIQHINSCCTLFVARHLALTAAFSHFVLCDDRLSSTRNWKFEFPLTKRQRRPEPEPEPQREWNGNISKLGRVVHDDSARFGFISLPRVRTILLCRGEIDFFYRSTPLWTSRKNCSIRCAV